MVTFIFGVNSTFKSLWEVFMISIAVLISGVIPVNIALKPPYSKTLGYEYALLAVDAMFLIDIFFTLRTAKFDLVTGEVVDNPFTLAKNYILSFSFLIDILCFLPWELFGDNDIFKLLGLIKILRVLRIRSFV
jgi:Ion transport protein